MKDKRHIISTFIAINTLAWRNLWRNYRRTLIMLIAITLGVWAMIFMSALMRGMVDEMVSSGISSLPGELQIHAIGYQDDPSIAHRLQEPEGALLQLLNSEQVSHWAMRVRVPGVIASERESRGVVIVGIDPKQEPPGLFFNGELIEGDFLQSTNEGGIVIGKRLAEKLETRLGKRVVLMSQNPENQISDRGFRIQGVYHSSLPAAEEQFVYAGRETLQKMLNMGKTVSEIVINTNTDYRNLSAIEAAFKHSLQENAQIKKWQDIDNYLATMLNVMDGFVLVWMVIVFLALSFGLLNTLAMAIFERIKEIGLMMALGMRRSQILTQIMIESLYLLIIGQLLGTLLAVVSILPFQDGIDLSIVAEGMAMMGAGSVLYPLLITKDLLLANTVVVSLGLLTSLIPAWRASKLVPVKAINQI